MTTAIHLCGPEDLERLLPLVEKFHQEYGLDYSDDHRIAALSPILAGSPLAVAYLFGPKNAPVGYLIMSFGWSIELGGMDGFLDEIWIKPNVRKRGIGTEALNAVIRALSDVGLKAVHLEVDREDADVQRLYARSGFKMRERYALMTRQL